MPHALNIKDWADLCRPQLPDYVDITSPRSATLRTHRTLQMTAGAGLMTMYDHLLVCNT